MTTILTAKAFESGKPGWKLDENGSIVLKDGNPVYLTSEGKEMTVGANKISELNAESKAHREAKEAAEAKLAVYKDIDPEKARKAIETVKDIDAKTLIDSGEVEKLKAQIKAEYETQIGEKDKALGDIQSRYDNLQINSVFKDSQFVRESIAVPLDMFEATFKSNFKIGKDGKVEAYDKSGNRIYSKEKVGEFATPDEALRLLVEMHPQKDTIIKANAGSGSGNQGAGGGTGQGKIIKRSDFSALPPSQQAETAAKAAKGEMKIVD